MLRSSDSSLSRLIDSLDEFFILNNCTTSDAVSAMANLIASAFLKKGLEKDFYEILDIMKRTYELNMEILNSKENL